MSKDSAEIAIYAMCLAIFGVSFVMGGLAGMDAGEDRVRAEAIKRGFAEYNQTTGAWQWKEPADAQ